MFEAGKTLETLMLDFFQDKPPDKFVASNWGKSFLKKLDSASNDWKFSFSYPFSWDKTSTEWRMHNNKQK